jgi:nucleoside-diphosphate-sugar epimerase
MAKILIAGCGDLGSRLGKSLAKKDHKVYGIRRNIHKIPNEIIPISCDICLQPPKVPNNIDYIYYILSAKSFNDNAYYKAYVLGVKNLLKAVKGQNIKRIFFISSTSVFGQSNGKWVDENSEVDDSSFSSKRLIEGENLIGQSEHPSTVIRFGGIYGKGRTHLIDLILDGKGHCLEDIFSNRINTDDCIGVLKHLLTINRSKKLADLYIGVDNKPTLSCEVYEWLAEQLSASDIEHIEPTENSRTKRSNKRLSNKKLTATGYKFKYPNFKKGYSALLEELAY